MPKGTSVERCYEDVKAKGHSEASAARICQHATGLSLKTGQPPKHSKMSADQHEGEPLRLSPEDWLDGLCEAMGCHANHA